MPTGVYPRKRAKQIYKAIKPLINKKKTKQPKLVMTIICERDGALKIDKMIVRSYFKAFQIILEEYAAKDIPITEVRIGHV